MMVSFVLFIPDIIYLEFVHPQRTRVQRLLVSSMSFWYCLGKVVWGKAQWLPRWHYH